MNTTTLTLPPYDRRTWEGTIDTSTPEVAAAILIKHYTESKRADVEKMKVECTVQINDILKKVTVSIRHNFRGILSTDLQEKGIIELDTKVKLLRGIPQRRRY